MADNWAQENVSPVLDGEFVQIDGETHVLNPYATNILSLDDRENTGLTDEQVQDAPDEVDMPAGTDDENEEDDVEVRKYLLFSQCQIEKSS